MRLVLLVVLACLSHASALRLNSIKREPRQYAKGDIVPVSVAHIVPGFSEARRTDTRPERRRSKAISLLPIKPYPLPSCRSVPAGNASGAHADEGLQFLLSGGHSQSALYKFQMMVDTKAKGACTCNGFAPNLTAPAAQNLRERIDEGYGVLLKLDGLPVTTLDLELDDHPEGVWPGYPLGYSVGGRHFLNNHLMFKILVSSATPSSTGCSPQLGLRYQRPVSSPGCYSVVGFEMVPCSIRRRPGMPHKDVPCMSMDDPDAPEPQEVTADTPIAYTYDVFWEESDITWERRWDGYLRLPHLWERARWVSVLISGMVAVGLGIAAAEMVRRAVREQTASQQFLCKSLCKPFCEVTEVHKQSASQASRTADVHEQPAGDASTTAPAVEVDEPPPEWLRSCTLGFFYLTAIATVVLLIIATVKFTAPASRGRLLPSLVVAGMLAAMPVALAVMCFWLWRDANRTFNADQEPVSKTTAQMRRMCTMVGFYTLLATAATAVLVMAAVGNLFAANRGRMLLLVMAVSVCAAPPAGFAAVWLWGDVNGSYKGWCSLCGRVSLIYAVVVLPALFQIYIVGADGIVVVAQLYAFLKVAAVTTSALYALCCTGGLVASLRPVGTRVTSVETGPQHAVAANWTTRSLLLHIAFSLPPFAACAVECFIAMSCLWQGYLYSVSGPVLLTATITAVITMEMSVICACAELPIRDDRWWLRAFRRSKGPGFFCLLASLAFVRAYLRPLSLSGAARPVLCTLFATSPVYGLAAVSFLSTFVFMKMLAHASGGKGTASIADDRMQPLQSLQQSLLTI